MSPGSVANPRDIHIFQQTDHKNPAEIHVTESDCNKGPALRWGNQAVNLHPGSYLISAVYHIWVVSDLSCTLHLHSVTACCTDRYWSLNEIILPKTSICTQFYIASCEIVGHFDVNHMVYIEVT